MPDVEQHLELVRILAFQMHRRVPSVELEELICEGNLALAWAAQRFDPTKGIKFATYAQHRVRGQLQDYLRRLDPLSRSERRLRGDNDNLTISMDDEGFVEPISSARSPEDAAVEADLIRKIDRSMRRNPRARALVRAHYLREQSQVDLGEQIGLSAAHVWDLVHEGLGMARRRLCSSK